ncbi:hypothetical protein DL98DRAFT_648754 [Cadophora sp. DSE1049]|nr:hypothetical protein DL98DRAFT_648754 [Cadophora sp. DSE1049]
MSGQSPGHIRECSVCQEYYRDRGDSPPRCPDPRRYFKRVKVSLSKPTQAMVAFVVGPEDKKQTFVVHRSLACASSSFFKAAFESNMLEGTSPTMRLEDVESEVFGMLVHYLYFRVLDDASFVITDIPGDAFDDYDYLLLAKLWKLGERFLVPDLQNEVMIELLERRDVVSKERLKKFAEYVCSTDGSFKDDGSHGKLKRVLLEIVAYTRYRPLFTGAMESMSMDMVLEVAHMLKEKVPPHNFRRERVDVQNDFFARVLEEAHRPEY